MERAHVAVVCKSRCWLLAMLLFALAACGGGGNSSNGGPPIAGSTPTDPPPAATPPPNASPPVVVTVATGVLDATFGADANSDGVPDGYTTLSGAGASAVAIDQANRILLTGVLNGKVAVWCFTERGVLDPSFGQDYNGDGMPDGYVTHTVDAYSAGGDLVLDAAGRIVVAGVSQNDPVAATSSYMTVWRFTASGRIDTTFGQDFNHDGFRDGFIRHRGSRTGATLGNNHGRGNAVALDSQGRIVVTGSVFPHVESNGYAHFDMALWRLTSSGELDLSFGADRAGKSVPTGFVEVGLPNGIGDDAGYGVAINKSGEIYVSGTTDYRGTMVLWRFRPNGTSDPAFGRDYNGDSVPDGYVLACRGSGQAVRLDANERPTIAGNSFCLNLFTDMGLWRYTASGEPDLSFGGNPDADGIRDGFVEYRNPSEIYEYAYGLDIDADGRLLVAGGTSGRLTLWRYTPAGDLDHSFGGDYDNNGIPDGFFVTSLDPASGGANDVALDAQGRIVVVGQDENGALRVLRLR